ncbi:MAG TPA: FecR domain-containing protein [Steroidobacteraceae bacterium]|nr:FecR domain-containing protein [Steroidobacteraceae bacterium]
MASRTDPLDKIAPRRIRARAARWVTELHAPDRDAELEASVRRWIDRDPRHAAAFELATDAWQRSGNLPSRLSERPPRRPAVPALAGMAVLCAACAGALYLLRDPTLVTGPAEQKTLELSDGTQVSLNANSRVIVQFDKHARKLTLTRGEALFDVAKQQPRPFVVIAGERKVIAMGTSFEVRREQAGGSAFAVTLVEGRVAIEPIAGPDVLPRGEETGLNQQRGGIKAGIVLQAGERLRFAGPSAESVDSPALDRVTAWRRGELIFDDTSLGEAAAEFNRYGSSQLAIEGAAVSQLRVGGVFKIGDTESFAHAMANAYSLKITHRGKTIALAARRPDSR